MIRKTAKHFLHRIIYPILVWLRLDKYFRNSSRKQMIIMFHGVSSTDSFSYNGRHLSANDFEKLLQYFAENFEVVSLSAIINDSNAKNQPRHRIALTFDDGYANNFDVALPILQHYKMPATFFCVGSRSGR